MEDSQVQKVHSAIRWGKAASEVETVVKDLGWTVQEAAAQADVRTGNHALHISAQNGHFKLTEFLLANKADPNVKNNKGQTPMHMSVEYDFYFQTKLLLEKGANKDQTNDDGRTAITGISGSKVGNEAWDNPVNVLRSAQCQQEVQQALAKLEEIANNLDKATVVQVGMAKKKQLAPEDWDQARFMKLVQSIA